MSDLYSTFNDPEQTAKGNLSEEQFARWAFLNDQLDEGWNLTKAELAELEVLAKVRMGEDA